MATDSTVSTHRGAGSIRVPRSRGAVSGLLLILLGVWGAVIPFVGPYFDFAYSPNTTWTWTSGRFWLEVLPGIAAVVGGFLLLSTANRAIAVFGGWLASAAGAWFVVGPLLGTLWGGPSGATGSPVGTHTNQVLEAIGFFYGLGAVILFLAAHASGRLAVRSIGDVRAAERREVVATGPVAERPAARDTTESTYPAEPGTYADEDTTAPTTGRRMSRRSRT